MNHGLTSSDFTVMQLVAILFYLAFEVDTTLYYLFVSHGHFLIMYVTNFGFWSTLNLFST